MPVFRTPHFILCLIAPLCSWAQGTLQEHYTLAMNAYKAKDYPAFYEHISKAGEINPYHQTVLYQRGKAAALTGKPDEALECLRKAILINASYPLESTDDFTSLRQNPGFQALIDLQKKISQPIVNSDTALVIRNRALHAEGISFDPRSGTFYLGSIHQRKVIKADTKGNFSDFCPPAFEGMTSTFGVRVDPARNRLWVCSSPMEEMEGYDSTARSAVFLFDLRSGKLIARFVDPKSGSIFGDLILNKKGEAWISDSKFNRILKVNEKTKTLEEYFTSGAFINIQGMAWSEDERSLYVADYVKGPFRLLTDTRKLQPLELPAGVSLKGIDGLYYYKHSLIAIQNGVSPLRCTRYYLNSTGSGISGYEIIDRGHPAFNEPTLGVLDGDQFYYIANSQWGGYDDNHRLKPEDQLQDIVILKARLK